MQIVDARLGPTELDMTMIGWLDFFKVPFVLVLTKADKLPHGKLLAQTADVTALLSKYKYMAGIFPFSALNGDGRHDLLKAVEDHVEQKGIPSGKALIHAVA